MKNGVESRIARLIISSILNSNLSEKELIAAARCFEDHNSFEDVRSAVFHSLNFIAKIGDADSYQKSRRKNENDIGNQLIEIVKRKRLSKSEFLRVARSVNSDIGSEGISNDETMSSIVRKIADIYPNEAKILMGVIGGSKGDPFLAGIMSRK